MGIKGGVLFRVVRDDHIRVMETLKEKSVEMSRGYGRVLIEHPLSSDDKGSF